MLDSHSPLLLILLCLTKTTFHALGTACVTPCFSFVLFLVVTSNNTIIKLRIHSILKIIIYGGQVFEHPMF